MIHFPLEQLIAHIGSRRVGLASTPASRVAPGKSIEDVLLHECRLSAFLALEHGLRGELQDGIEFGSYDDGRTGLPVYSFYGAQKRVPPEFFSHIDLAVFCVQDVSHRAYTFKQALAELLHGAAQSGVPVALLDRPTPLAHLGAQGPCRAQFFPLALPVTIPYTLGELAMMLVARDKLAVNLKVFKVKGWDRNSIWDCRALPWIPPSPNIPNLTSAYAYAVSGLLQATNVSEGRGTCKPFEFFGAPFVDPAEVQFMLTAAALPGIEWRGTYFKPAFNKFAGEVCGGVQMMLIEPRALDPIRTSVQILKTLAMSYPDKFAPANSLPDWLDGKPRQTADLATLDVAATVSEWQKQANAFVDRMQTFELYGN